MSARSRTLLALQTAVEVESAVQTANMGILQSLLQVMLSDTVSKVAQAVQDPLPDLHAACLSRDPDKVAKALSVNVVDVYANINHPVWHRPTSSFVCPIHCAPYHGPIVAALLKNGAKIDAQTVRLRVPDQATSAVVHETVLVMNTRAGNADMVKFLLDHHADPDVKTADGHTALEVAAAAFSQAARSCKPLKLAGVSESASAAAHTKGKGCADTTLVALQSSAKQHNGLLCKWFGIYNTLLLHPARKGGGERQFLNKTAAHVLQGLVWMEDVQAQYFDRKTARKWLRSLAVRGADFPDNVAPRLMVGQPPRGGGPKYSWCIAFAQEVRGFTSLHWVVAECNPVLLSKYIGRLRQRHGGRAPEDAILTALMACTQQDLQCTPLALAVRPDMFVAPMRQNVGDPRNVKIYNMVMALVDGGSDEVDVTCKGDRLVEGAPAKEMEAQVEAQVEARVEARVEAQVKAQVEAQVAAQVEAQVESGDGVRIEEAPTKEASNANACGKIAVMVDESVAKKVPVLAEKELAEKELAEKVLAEKVLAEKVLAKRGDVNTSDRGFVDDTVLTDRAHDGTRAPIQSTRNREQVFTEGRQQGKQEERDDGQKTAGKKVHEQIKRHDQNKFPCDWKKAGQNNKQCEGRSAKEPQSVVVADKQEEEEHAQYQDARTNARPNSKASAHPNSKANGLLNGKKHKKTSMNQRAEEQVNDAKTLSNTVD